MSKSILKVPSAPGGLDGTADESDLSKRELPYPPKPKKKVGFSDDVVRNVYENFMTEEEEEEYRKLEERALVAVAKADYKSDAPGDLCFQAGQLIDDLVEEEGGWWSGEIDGKRGIFPNTYVRFMPKEMAAKAQTLSAPPTTSMRKLTLSFGGGGGDVGDEEEDEEEEEEEGDAANTSAGALFFRLSSGDSTVPIKATADPGSPGALKLRNKSASFKSRTSVGEDSFANEPWYHGPISRKESEDLFLRSNRQDGWFLIRKSTRTENTYVVSQSYRGQLFHNQVFFQSGQYVNKLAGSFKTMHELIEKHKSDRGHLQSPLAHPCLRAVPAQAAQDEDDDGAC